MYLTKSEFDKNHLSLSESLQKMIGKIIEKEISILNPEEPGFTLLGNKDIENQQIMFYGMLSLESITINNDCEQDASKMISKFYKNKKRIFKEVKNRLNQLSQDDLIESNIAPDNYKIEFSKVSGKLRVYSWVSIANNPNSNFFGLLNTDLNIKITLKIQCL